MPRSRPSRRSTLFACGLPFVLGAVPVGVTWHAWWQEKLNQALIVAIKRNDVPAALRALDRGADANTREQTGPRSLWLPLLTLLHQDVPSQGTGSTALLIALEPLPDAPDQAPRGYYEFRAESTVLVAALLSHGADVHSSSPSFERQDTPLQWAACAGKAATCRLLVQQGARLNVCNHYGNTALMEAVWNGKENSVRALIALGANVTIKDKGGRTPLHQATTYEMKAIARLLKAARAKE